jgi:hypothetical protein
LKEGPRGPFFNVIEDSILQGDANTTHEREPRFDTADFADALLGNLRADHVLPARTCRLLVWIDVRHSQFRDSEAEAGDPINQALASRKDLG